MTHDDHIKAHALMVKHRCETDKYFRFHHHKQLDNFDHIKEGLSKRIRNNRYLPGSAIWHDRLEAECYFIAGDCI